MATTNYDWGDKNINKYYNRNLELMKPNTAEAPTMELPAQTRESIRDQIRGYMNPALDKALKSLERTRDYDREVTVRDPNSRGASSNRSEPASNSDWYKHARRNRDVGETFARGALVNNYLSTIAKDTAEQYNKYLDRRLDYDAANASMALDASKFNSKVRDDFEEMLYNRSVARSKGRF